MKYICVGKTCLPACLDEQSRKTFQQGLTSMLFATSIKELQEQSLPFAFGVLRQFALLAIIQQTGKHALPPQTRLSSYC